MVPTNIQSNFEWDRVTRLRENCFRVDTRVELIVPEKSAFDNDPCACFEVNKANSKFSVHNLPLEITVCDQQVQIYRSCLFLTARFPHTSRVIWGIFLRQHGHFVTFVQLCFSLLCKNIGWKALLLGCWLLFASNFCCAGLFLSSSKLMVCCKHRKACKFQDRILIY